MLILSKNEKIFSVDTFFDDLKIFENSDLIFKSSTFQYSIFDLLQDLMLDNCWNSFCDAESILGIN